MIALFPGLGFEPKISKISVSQNMVKVTLLSFLFLALDEVIKLCFNNRYALLNLFGLCVPHRDKSGYLIRAEIIGRRGGEIGIVIFPIH